MSKDNLKAQLEEYFKSPEQRRFSMKILFNYHLSLYQNFNSFNIQFSISHSDADEHNWLIVFFIAFWGFEYSWNSRNPN